ncbi:hypothetical protein V6N13_072897 [Hibiscus sabdariffa]
MAEDTLGLGFARTLEISSWPRLEQQGLPVDSDEQHVTKKVKNRDGNREGRVMTADGVPQGTNTWGAVHNNQGNHSFPLANKQADKVSSKDLFGTWMLVEDRRRRTLRNDNAGKSMIKETSGSRFDILHNFPVEDETRDDNCLRGTSGEVSLGAYVVAMIPGRVPTVISKGSSGSTDQHQAITIVEEEDGREGGNGPVSQAGSKGFGKKKVQFKKKSELRISNRVLSSEWSDVVNICSDTSRQCDVVGDDVVLWVKSPDDPRSTIEMSTEGQAVADMVQSNEEMNPVLVVD